MREKPAEPSGTGEPPETAEPPAGGAGEPGAQATPGPSNGAGPVDRPEGAEPEAGAGEAGEIGQAILTGAAYGALFVLGVVLGVVGALEHSWYVAGGLPVVAVAWLAVVFAVPYGMGRLMGTKLAAATTAVGWGIVSAVLAVQRDEGDLLIAATAPGYIYLYGGMVAVAVAVLLTPSPAETSWLLTPRFGAPPPEEPTRPPR